MKQLSTGLCALAIVFLVSSPRQVQAQTTAVTRAGQFRYDVADEVTLAGTVSSVLTKGAAGMIAGSHLLLATPNGPVDASLGRFGLRGNGAVSVSVGKQVEVTGVMRTIDSRSFLLVRTVKVDGEIYTIRNVHGLPLSPQARARAGQKTGQKGESL